MTIAAEYFADTSLGQVSISPTNDSHIFITFTDRVTLRGVIYSTAAAHFYKHSDGRWHLGREHANVGVAFFDAISLSRPDHKDVSDAARRAFGAFFAGHVSAFVRDNPTALVRAAVQDMTDDIERIDADIAKHEAALTELRSARWRVIIARDAANAAVITNA